MLLPGTRPASPNAVQLFADVLGLVCVQGVPGLGLSIAQRLDGHFPPHHLPCLSPFHPGLWLLFAKLCNTRHSLSLHLRFLIFKIRMLP